MFIRMRKDTKERVPFIRVHLKEKTTTTFVSQQYIKLLEW